MFVIHLQVLSRLDRPEVATVPGIVFWLLEGEGIHRYPAPFQLRVVPINKDNKQETKANDTFLLN